MSDRTSGESVELDGQARTKLDDYLKWVKKDLKEVEPAERKAILAEIEDALDEKLGIIGRENGAGPVDGARMDRVLDDFGSPSEVAREYSGVASVAMGPGLRIFMLLEVAFAIIMGAIGVMLIKDVYDWNARGWGFDPFGVIWGSFWIVLMGVTLASTGLQFRKKAAVPELGPFTLLTLLAFGLSGLVILAFNRWQIGWIFGVEDKYHQDVLLAGLTVTLIVLALCGAWLIWSFTRRIRSKERQKLLPDRARFSRGSKLFITIASLLLVAIFVAGNYTWLYNPYSNERPARGEERFIMSDAIGGPYNATIKKIDYFDGAQWWDGNKIVYNVGGKEVEGWFGLETVKAMDWIKDSTPENATVVAWWDHGISIRGYTGRNCTIYYPSEELLHTVGDPSSIKEFEPQEKVRSTAEVYMAENGTQLQARMAAVGAQYIFVTWRYSSEIAYALMQGAGRNVDDYLDSDLSRTQGRYLPTPAGERLFLFKIWKGDFEGAHVVYRDIDNLVVAVP